MLLAVTSGAGSSDGEGCVSCNGYGVGVTGNMATAAACVSIGYGGGSDIIIFYNLIPEAGSGGGGGLGTGEVTVDGHG